jgi:hypothetical protein
MQYKTYKQFRKTFEVLDVPNNDYIKYVISLGYKNDNTFIVSYTKLYEGKSLVINNKTTIDYTSIVNNAIYRQRIGFNSNTQCSQIQGVWQGSNIKNEETNNADLVNSIIKIELYDDEELLNTYKTEFTIFEVEHPHPYTNFQIPNVKLYNNSIIENHIPFIKSDNYFITVPLITYNNAIASIKTDSTPNLKLTNGVCGNYILNIPLLTLYNELETVSNDTVFNLIGSIDSEILVSGGNATTIFDKEYKPLNAEIEVGDILADGNNLFLSYGNDVIGKLATIDTCCSDWYLSWLDIHGFHSVALNNVEIVNDFERTTLKNIYQEDIVVKSKAKQTFNIKTKKLTNEEYQAYQNMLQSSFVVLYNTLNDEIYYCTVEDATSAFIRNNNAKFFTATLKQITTINY